MKKIIILLIPAIFIITGCHEFGGGVRGGSASHYPAGNLPPAHAPAHGRRSIYRYHYYPEARFYLDITRNIYFYLDSRGDWAVSARLPYHLHRYRSGHHVEIEMDIDRPYHRYHDHRRKYPPGQVKKKNKHNKKYKKKKYDDDNDDYKRRGRMPYNY